MPRQLQLRPPGQGKIPNDPNNKLKVDPLAFLGDNPFATMTEAVLFGAANTMLQIIDDTTGLDLLPAAKMLEDVFGTALSGPGMPDFLTFLDGQPATDPVTGLATPSTNPVGLFTGFLSWATGGFGVINTGESLLSVLIGAGGGNTSATNLVDEFVSIFSGGGLPAIFTTGLDTGVSLISQLPSVMLWPLTSLESGTLPLGIGLGSLSQVPGMTGLLGGLDTTGSTSMLDQLFNLGFLTSAMQLPQMLFGGLTPGSTTNLVFDPFFTIASNLIGLGLWNWSSLAPATGLFGEAVPAGAGSWQVQANGMQSLMGLPFPVPALSDTSSAIQAGIKVFWSAITGTGTVIQLAVNSYTGLNSDGSVILPAITDPNRVVAVIDSPPANSIGASGADANGFVPLIGTWQPPAGAQYAALAMEVLPAASSGTVNFGHGLFDVPNLLDASRLANVSNIPMLFINTLQGFSGLIDMIETFGHITDGLGTSFAGVTQNGLTFSDLFNLATGTSQNANSALSGATSALGILQMLTNKPVSQGMDPSAEATIHAQNATDLITIATGTSLGVYQRIGQKATKGFLDVYISKTSGSGIYKNIYKVNTTTGVKTLLWGSSDIALNVPTSTTTPGQVRTLIPGANQPVHAAGDLLLLTIVNNTGANIFVKGRNTGLPNHSTVQYPSNVGATRTIAALGIAPATLNPGDTTDSGSAPHISYGVANVPMNYHPSQLWPYMPVPTTSGTIPPSQTWTWTWQSWLSTGDFIDLIGLGGGGGGAGSNYGDPSGFAPGGRPGTWVARRLVVGTDIKIGTNITIQSGLAGQHADGYSRPGHPGLATVFTWTKPDNTTDTMTCPGGFGGDAGVYGADFTGLGAGTYNFNGHPYQAGGNVGSNAFGSSPGGGGGGGSWPYTVGAPGSDGGGWVYAQQAIGP